MIVIRLTCKYNKRPTWFNWSNVIMFVSSTSGGTHIQTIDGVCHEVDETPVDILAQIPKGDLS